MNYINPKFCKKCGVRLELKETGFYDEETGEKIVKAACPTGECFHTGISHEWEPSGLFSSYLFKCVKCGFKGYD